MDEVELEARLKQIEARLAKAEAGVDLLYDLRKDCPERMDPPPPKPAKVQPKDGAITWQQVSGAFAKRYQAARGLAWSSGPHVQSLMDIADALNIQPGDRTHHGKTLMDNFFSDTFAAKAGFPVGLLAKQFGRYLMPPDEAQTQERTLQRVKAEEAERRYQEAKRQAEADHAKKVAEKAAQGPQWVSEAVGELKTWLRDTE